MIRRVSGRAGQIVRRLVFFVAGFYAKLIHARPVYLFETPNVVLEDPEDNRDNSADKKEEIWISKLI